MKIAWGGLAGAAVAVVVVALTIFFWPSAWSKVVSEVNAARQAANGSLQKKRGLAIAEDGLNQLTEPNVAIGVDAQELESLEPTIVEQLNKSEDLKNNKITVHDAQVQLASQSILADIRVTYVGPVGTITAAISADGTVSMSGPNIVYQLFARDVSVETFKPADSRIGETAAKAALNAAIDLLLSIGNVALDKMVNQQGKLVTHVDKIKLFTSNFNRIAQPKGMRFEERAIDLDWHPEALATLVEPTRIIVLGQMANKPPQKPWISPQPNIADLTDEQTKKRVEDYRDAFAKKFNKAFAYEFKAAEIESLSRTGSFVALKKALISSTLNSSLNAPAIRLSGAPPVNESVQNVDIAIPPLPNLLCGEVRNKCTYKHVCESKDKCTETVQETVEKVVDVPRQVHRLECRLISLGGLIKFLKRLCDDVVDTVYDKVVQKSVQTVTRPVSSPVCEGFRQTQKATPLLCDGVSNLAKATCDATQLPNDAFCLAEQGFRQYAAHNPVATAELRLGLAPQLDATISNFAVRADLGQMGAQVSGSAKSPVSVSVKWTNHAPVLCVFNWKEGFNFDAEAELKGHPITFELSDVATEPGSTLELRFKILEDSTRIDLNKSPLDEIFVRHPQVTVNCPLLAAGAVAYGAYDTVVNEKFKQLSGIWTGKDVKVDISKTHFAIKVPQIRIGSKEAPVSLAPRFAKDALLFVH